MIVLRARNVNTALPMALHMIRTQGVPRDSRNGRVLVMPEPVATVYSHPCERVLFHAWRDANPFFHFYEALWMLAGRNDIAPLTRYAKQIAMYSDDGVTQNAAYGHRWRQMPIITQYSKHESGDEPYDQLKVIATNLKKNKDSRQEVLQIWDHVRDLGTTTKDHACNLTATFQVDTDGRLNLVVFCRSNDLLWGCYGANAVHFSTLLEYMALRVGVPVGTYTQISVNLHAYDATTEKHYGHGVRVEDDAMDPYQYEPIYAHPIGRTDMDRWDEDCRAFVTTDGRLPDRTILFGDTFWTDVAWPIVSAHDIYKDADPSAEKWVRIKDALSFCKAQDWRVACTEWIQRRQQKWENEQR